MDPVKVIIFVGAFLLLLLLGKKLSSSGDVHAGPYVPEPSAPGTNAPVPVEEDSLAKWQPAVVGSDLPFPVHLPDLELRDDGSYNRPEFLNYYFSKIDLIQGPPDPDSFCDDFFVETRNPQDEHVGTYKYLVATPAGLQHELDSTRAPAISLGDRVVIVARWDLPLILDAAVKEIIKTYGEWTDYSGEHALPDTDRGA